MAKSDIANKFNQHMASQENAIVIDSSDLIATMLEEISLYDMSRRELEEKYISSRIRELLWQMGFRSVKYGQKIYVNINGIRDIDTIKTLFNNANKNLISKEKAKRVIGKILDDRSKEIEGQLRFDSNGYVTEEKEDKEIIEFLLQFAEKTS